MDEDLKQLTHQRGTIKGRLTKFENYITVLQQIDPSNLVKLQISELQFKLTKIENLYDTFDEIQGKIERLTPSSKLDDELEERDKIESTFSTLCSLGHDIIASVPINISQRHSTEVTASSGDSNSNLQTKHIKLPTIALPSFDGNNLNWLEFRDTFDSLIHQNSAIPAISKFHYLRSALQGSASVVIKSIECTSSNYQIAWDLLNERFNNSKLLISTHLKSLFNFDQMNKESHKSLRFLVDHISKNLRSLRVLEEPTEHWDTLIIFMMTARLDGATGRKWEEYKGTLTSITLEDFYRFLRNRADVLETLQVNKTEPKPDNRKFNKQTTSLVSSLDVEGTSNIQCVLCKQDHRIYNCPRFKSLTPEARLQEVNKLKLCSNCLRPNHHRSNCKMGNCRICGRKHNSLLHNSQYNTTNTSTTNSGNVQQNTSPNTQTITKPDAQQHTNNTKVLQTTTHANRNTYSDSIAFPVAVPSQVLLSTALVNILDPATKATHLARALLDSGSQSSFLSEKLQRKLNLTTSSNSVAVTGINNGVSHATQCCNLVIKSRYNAFKFNVSCVVIPYITGNLPSVKFDPNQLHLPADISLADPEFYCPSEIDLLLGADVFWDIINTNNNHIKLGQGQNQPILQKTRLGWVLAGSMGGSHTNSNTTHCNFSREILEPLSNFWELEEVDSNHKLLSAHEEFCEAHFTQTTTRLNDGRFCVTIPLREIPEAALGNSYNIAKRRFLNLEQRLSKSPPLKQSYTEFINEYRDLGHLTEIEKPSTFANYIPHHAVIREQSESTRLRVVFDASCKTASGKSFNEIQVVGPTVQDDLFSILIRFRQNPCAVTSDIEKMYRQCLITPSQRNLQLILWRDDESKPLQTLQLNTITYGTASAPFLSTRCLVQVAAECNDPIVSKAIRQSFYVDDCLLTERSPSELQTVIAGVTHELAKAQFPLRKFRTNCPEIFDNSNICHTNDHHEFSKQSSILGLIWSPSNDTLQFATDIEIPQSSTKRSILSTASQIFDPLGILAATIIIPKQIIQKLWQNQLEWDTPVSVEIEKEWKEFANNIKLLATIKIPRHVSLPSPRHIEIHVFTDASSLSYAACLYIRSIDKANNVSVNLLCAKTKVAPLKPTTIPRLELCGALLGARLYSKVSKAIDIPITHSTFWSDSSVVLGWIKTQPKTLKPFVCNRVQEIRDLTTQNAWRFIPGTLNPADLGSRGIRPQQLINASIWWSGPPFLMQCTKDDWPPNIVPDITLPELKVHVAIHEENIINFQNHSNLRKLQRILAYALRFVNNIRHGKTNKSTDTLSSDELHTSLITLAKLSQRDTFSKEIKTLASNKGLSPRSHLLALNPFLDSRGVLRVGGRIQNSIHYNFDKKHPVLIDPKHQFTKLLFEREHIRLLHCGPLQLLSSIRDQFWPLRGRDIARKTVGRCVICIRMRGQTIQPIMGNLPEHRITPASTFETCGIDFGGPYHILSKRGRGARTSKCYLCLYVCGSTKSLHLDVVSDMSSNAFIMCLRRFVSRRGKPKLIFCDNGTNLVGANNELNRMLKSCRQPVSEYAAEEGIQFQFNPAYSPNFGGLFEAGIKSAKHLLKRVAGNTNLTFEELTTLFCQIEAILNSRPLTPLSSDPSDLSPLTPGHFLIGRPLTSLPSPTTERISISRYQLLERLRQTFWARWSKEYICELQQRVKWRKQGQSLVPGDLVIIRDEGLPPMMWQMGRIENIYTGTDGVCRVADVRTKKTVVKRAISRLCPLPTSIDA